MGKKGGVTSFACWSSDWVTCTELVIGTTIRLSAFRVSVLVTPYLIKPSLSPDLVLIYITVLYPYIHMRTYIYVYIL